MEHKAIVNYHTVISLNNFSLSCSSLQSTQCNKIDPNCNSKTKLQHQQTSKRIPPLRMFTIREKFREESFAYVGVAFYT